MARMLTGGPAEQRGERAYQSSMEMMLSRLSEVELENDGPAAEHGERAFQ